VSDTGSGGAGADSEAVAGRSAVGDELIEGGLPGVNVAAVRAEGDEDFKDEEAEELDVSMVFSAVLGRLM
jgi:hypothetical protein